jgi:putative membrane protein
MHTAILSVAAPSLQDAPLWRWRPDVWLLVIVLYGGYRYAIAALRPADLPRRRAVTRQQHLCYATGVAILWLATDGPLDTIGEAYLLSVHMVQFLALTLVVPPLLLLGTPDWLLRRMLTRPAVDRVVAPLTRPIVAIIVFNAVIAVSHWPPVVDLYLRSELFHLAMHIAWVATALAWWWPVLSPLPERPHLSTPLRMGYLFLLSVMPTVPASFLTFGRTPLYDAYARAAPLVGVAPMTDQRIAGLLMKIAGGLWIWAIIAALFFRWSHESTTGAPDWLYARQPVAGGTEVVDVS